MMYHDSTGKLWEPKITDEIQWRISAYAMIVDKDRVFVITPHYKNVFTLPGGGVDTQEDIIEGLKRECQEEAGFDIILEQAGPYYLGESRFYLLGKFYHSVNIVYRCTVRQEGLPTNRDDGEVASTEWKSISEIKEEDVYFHLWPSFKRLQESMQLV